MAQDFLNYSGLVEAALRGVVRLAIEQAAREGLPGAHHFYIAFRTAALGVELADHLRAKYPDDMTIVLQHQFWDLEIDDEGFSVTLSFGGAREWIRVPFAAISAFSDPSVPFGLQFTQSAEAPVRAGPPVEKPETTAADSEPSESADKAPAGSADVVALDAFRNKK